MRTFPFGIVHIDIDADADVDADVGVEYVFCGCLIAAIPFIPEDCYIITSGWTASRQSRAPALATLCTLL